MKVKNLLKKVGAVMTTAALLATLGTTAFADGVDVKKEVAAGGNVSITGVTATDKGNDVYEIKVDYTTTIDNKVGMTMLTYRASGEDEKPADTALSTKYSDTMQIVGIAQSADNKAKDSSGSFIFNVTTKQGEDTTNKYYIQKGKTVLIAVSGDQCTPAYATFSLDATAKSATCTLGSVDDPVPIGANLDLNQALNKMVEADKIVFYDENNEPIDNATANLENVDFSKVEWKKDSSGAYIAKFDLLKDQISGVDINGDSIPVNLTAYVEIQDVNAEKVSEVDGFTAAMGTENTFGKTYSADINTEESAIKEALFKDKTAKIGNGAATGTVTLDPSWATSTGESSYDKTTDGDQNLVYEVTIPSTATVTGNEHLKIAADGLKFTVNVTVSRTQYINAITLKDAPESIEVSSTATDEQIKEALNKAIENAMIKIDGTVADKSKLTMEWVIVRTENVPTSAKLHVSAVDSSLGNLPAAGIDVTPSIGITVKTGSKYGLADLNGDGSINALDAAEVMKKFLNSTYEFKDANGEVIGDINAKLTNDDAINALDAAEVMKKFLNSAYKFPIEL